MPALSSILLSLWVSFLDPGHLSSTSTMPQRQSLQCFQRAAYVVHSRCSSNPPLLVRTIHYTRGSRTSWLQCAITLDFHLCGSFEDHGIRRLPSQARSVHRVPYPQRLPIVATINHPANSDHLATTTWRNNTRTGVLRLFASLGAHSKATRWQCPVALRTRTSQSTTCMLATTACLQWTSTLAVHKCRRIPSHPTNVSLHSTHVV